MFHVIKKLGFKEVSDFYKQIADGQLDVNTVIDKYVELKEGEKVVTGDNMARSASEFDLDESRFSQMNAHMTDDTLVIDDIGIVNNLTSIISKDERLVLRSINIDSHDGLFSGNLVVMLEDTSRLEALIKKLRTVKGVKQVERI